ncbi:MAG: extracellular solute-binding protein [Streptosporangiales bacterium]|nr:extracellular solute-binding protein [Streptosporangiales bacterium]
MAELSRRGLLRAAALLPAAGAVGSTVGCGGNAGIVSLRPTVRVAVTWSAGELQAFRSVLNGLGPREYSVEMMPFGDDISTALGTRATGRPDVVLLPRPGLVADRLDALEPLPPTVAERWRYARIWDDLLFHRGPGNAGGRQPYGVPFKIAHKSAVWYRTDVFAAYGIEPPRSWSEWREINARLIRLGRTPLALAGGDGWALTDFFENVLLASARDTYDRLAAPSLPRPWTSPAVRRALRLLGRMWSPQGALAGGARRCMVLQFQDALLEVFRYGRAAMVVVPDFAELVINRFAADPSTVGVFTFPAVDGDDEDPVPGPHAPPVVVGGDVAVLAKPSNRHARDLVTRLATPTAPLPWINPDGGRGADSRSTSHGGGFIAAHLDTPMTEYSRRLRPLAERLARPAGRMLRFDLSDRVGPVGSTQGMFRVLQDFLENVGDGGTDRVSAAADDAARRLRGVEDRLIEDRDRGSGHG